MEKSFIDYRENLHHLILKINKIREAPVLLGEPEEYFQCCLKLSNILENLQENLKVVIVGGFNVGKSTFVNALIGKKILPDAIIPCTGLISHVSYGEAPKATLIKDDKTEHIIDITELQDYVTIEASPREWKYLYLEYPGNLCKQGIDLVDTPGLNDPENWDELTKDYMDKADTIIYFLSCMSAYSAQEKEMINSLVSRGYDSMFFILGHLDTLLQNDELTQGNQFIQLKEYIAKNLMPLTRLGKSGVFYISALQALQGRLRGDNKLLKRSRIEMAEKELFNYLTHNSGKIKLRKNCQDIYFVGEELKERLTSIYEKKYNKRETSLQLQESSKYLLEELIHINDRIESKSEDVRGDLKRFISDKIEIAFRQGDDEVEEWIHSYSGDALFIDALVSKSTREKYVNEHLAEVIKRFNLILEETCNNSIIPYAKDKFLTFKKDIENIMKDYEKHKRKRLQALSVNSSNLQHSLSLSGTSIDFDLSDLLIQLSGGLGGAILIGMLAGGIMLAPLLAVVGMFVGNAFIKQKKRLKQEIVAAARNNIFANPDSKKRCINEIYNRLLSKSNLNEVEYTISETINKEKKAQQKTIEVCDSEIKFSEKQQQEVKDLIHCLEDILEESQKLIEEIEMEPVASAVSV